ncbi:ABC transporter ATP-binding protein [Pseudohalioglobus lutimaris]|uniref:ABC transporter ATP-binding protein n=1 Tax=Pseudohalioglobus lutimaris TaxID=1737061 RepID=A0A2N5WY41_9GAMM|nr:ABC transporter ATP-binding protein [Pseudohalioglobus lutimaris]PLW67128.1 ABC transporter ATP-binding protein [Pseudohalioglobus lutimaris]
MKPILEFRGVSRSYESGSGTQTVLRDVNISIFAGEFSAITGPSGSGKSTFLNLCALLDEPTTGEIYFDDVPTSGLSEALLCNLRKNAVGMVFQQYCLLPYRTVLENVLFRFRYLDMDSAETRKLARNALAMVGLEGFEDRSTHQLSGGEMQRVGIARAIALKPRLLVADEPTGNLDSAAAAQVMRCLQQLGEQGDIAILLVTHDESLLKYTSRHLSFNDGLLTECE